MVNFFLNCLGCFNGDLKKLVCLCFKTNSWKELKRKKHQQFYSVGTFKIWSLKPLQETKNIPGLKYHIVLGRKQKGIKTVALHATEWDQTDFSKLQMRQVWVVTSFSLFYVLLLNKVQELVTHTENTKKAEIFWRLQPTQRCMKIWSFEPQPNFAAWLWILLHCNSRTVSEWELSGHVCVLYRRLYIPMRIFFVMLFLFDALDFLLLFIWTITLEALVHYLWIVWYKKMSKVFKICSVWIKLIFSPSTAWQLGFLLSHLQQENCVQQKSFFTIPKGMAWTSYLHSFFLPVQTAMFGVTAHFSSQKVVIRS